MNINKKQKVLVCFDMKGASQKKHKKIRLRDTYRQILRRSHKPPNKNFREIDRQGDLISLLTKITGR
jgi:hypothetical protein